MAAPIFNLKEREVVIMGLKEVYELLEKSEDGKKLVDDVKAEIEKVKSVEAKARTLESEKKKLEAKLAEMAKEKSDADDDEAEGEAPPAKPKADDRKKSAEDKRIKALLDKLEASEKARQEMEAKAKADKLRSEVNSWLKDTFGKFGDVLTDSVLSKGLVKLGDSGGIVYETSDRIYDKDAALELLKSEYKEYLAPKGGGSGQPPPTVKPGAAQTPSAVDEMLKKTPSQLFAAGLAAKQ